MIKQGIIHSHVPLNTNLQAVAARITLHRTITICSICIPPSFNLKQTDLNSLVNQLPVPYILLGDFTGHNAIWGSGSYNTKGRLIEKFIANQALSYLNNGTHTYLHPGTGSYTCIKIILFMKQ